MTLAQMVSFCRNRHNAVSDTFYSDDEIYGMITARANEILSEIGLLEDTDTDTSVASQQAYNYPTDAVEIRQVNYKADRLKFIPFRKWELFKTEDSTTSGTPTHWTQWNDQILLVPIPDTAGDTITIYHYKEHAEIDNTTQLTVDIPGVLHGHLANGVIADMFAKDLNSGMFDRYENKFQGAGMKAFRKYKVRKDYPTGFNPIGDCDSEDSTGLGVT